MSDAVGQLNEHGYVLVPGAIPAADIEAAQADLFEIFPPPERFAAGDTDLSGPFGGLRDFPFPGDALHRLILHPELRRLAEATLCTSDLRIYQVSLWAKYAGAGDYEQELHADFGNHTLVVPSDEPGMRQLITWVMLSDFAADKGATRILSRHHAPDLRLGWYSREEHPMLYEREVPVVGNAGTVFAYGPDVLHRGAAFTAPQGGRFTLIVSFRSAAAEWAGQRSWPAVAQDPQMVRLLTRCSAQERELFGFPAPDDPYWTPATVQGVAARYPNMDLSEYEARVGSRSFTQ